MVVEAMTAKDYKSEVKPIWCPGCGDFGVLASVYEALAQMEVDTRKVVIVSGIGCSGRFPAFTTCYGFHVLHGRVMPVLIGIKAANPELIVIGVSGDGDATAIGGNHFMHSCRKNIDTVYLLLDNNLYALTKGQTSPTTPEEEAEHIPYPESPYGTYEEPIEPCTLAISFGATWVGRQVSTNKQALTKLIIEAVQHPGFSLLHVFSPCVSFYRESVDLYKQKATPLPEGYDPLNNKIEAVKFASDPERKHVGVLYKTYRPTFEERIMSIQQKAVQMRGEADIAKMINRYLLDSV